METLDFTKHDKDWWAWLLCENGQAVELITKSPDFKPDALNVLIEVNGVKVAAAEFNGFMEAMVGLATQQRIEERGFHLIQQAAEIRARAMLASVLGDMQDKANELSNNIDNMNGSLSSMLERAWNQNYIRHAGDRLRRAVRDATVQDDKKENQQSVTASTEITTNLPNGNGQLSISAYGATEGEARLNLEHTITSMLDIKPLASED